MTVTEHNRAWVNALRKTLSYLRDEADNIIGLIDSHKISGDELESVCESFYITDFAMADSALRQLCDDEVPVVDPEDEGIEWDEMSQEQRQARIDEMARRCDALVDELRAQGVDVDAIINPPIGSHEEETE